MSLFNKALPWSLLLACLLPVSQAWAQANPALNGHWLVNESLSDNTDKQVEKALKKAGEQVKSSRFDSNKQRYRGGPPEQELYDRFSYDPVLTISAQASGYLFEYADGFKSVVYTDNRSHSVSLNDLAAQTDFLLGHWEAGKFQVEAHPRDGGTANITYSLLENGKRLKASFIIKPQSFSEPIELERVYDRSN